jgi:hypothetical protein
MRGTIFIATSIVALAACGGGGGGNAVTGIGGGGGAAGPGSVTPPAPPPANITIATPDGSAEIRSGDATLANWPEGVPAYPGADSRSVNVTSGAPGQAGRILGFRTIDSPQRVINFYADAILRSGYNIENQMDLGESATLSARRGQSVALNITATRAADATQVQIVAAAGR